MRPGVSIIPDVLGSLAYWVIAVPPGIHSGYPFGLEEKVTDEQCVDHVNAYELYVEFLRVWIEKSA